MNTYPVVKIPDLIAGAKPIIIRHRETVFHPKIPKTRLSQLPIYLEYVGWGAIILSIFIFAIGVVNSTMLLRMSPICLCLGIAILNAKDLIPSSKGKSIQEVQIIEKIQTIHPDWQTIFQGKIIPYEPEKSTAQVGVSEKYFQKYLQKYFESILHPSYRFKINDEYAYSSDFTLILPNGISIVLEIDEPYNGLNNQPHHCTDDPKDDRRDEFFTNGNWVVIRLSEFQICAYPDECCYFIARIVNRIVQHNIVALDRFTGVGELTPDHRWTSQESRQMAKDKYRVGYLAKYNVYGSKCEVQPILKRS
jgi:very-short-patch-repair endonuclease